MGAAQSMPCPLDSICKEAAAASVNQAPRGILWPKIGSAGIDLVRAAVRYIWAFRGHSDSRVRVWQVRGLALGSRGAKPGP